MTQVRLKGTPQTQWNIGGHYYPGRDLVDLSDDLIKKHKDVITEVLNTNQFNVKNTPINIYTEKVLMSLSKDEQIIILKKLGASKFPKTEKERASMITQLQRGDEDE